jgi:hypothetical protein
LIGGGIVAVCLVLALCGLGALVVSTGSPTPPARSTAPYSTPFAPAALDLMDTSEFARLRQIASGVADPRARRMITETVRIGDLLALPQTYANATIHLSARVVRRTIVYNLAPGWQRAVAFIVEDGAGSLPVLYRGYGEPIQPGDTVDVTGVLSVNGLGILADSIEPSDWTIFWLANPLWTQVVLSLAGCVGGALGILAVGFLARRRHAARLAGFIALLMLGISGCRMDIATAINADGSGLMSVQLVETTENVNFIKQMPNMADYLFSWFADLREQGMMIAEWRQGKESVVFLQNRFASLDALSVAPISADQSSTTTWVYATRTESPKHTTFRFSGLLDTTTFYRVATGIDSQAQAEIRKQFDQMQITYSLVLPGEIVYSNADKIVGNRLTWNIKMNARTEMRAEARVEHPTPLNLYARVATAISAVWAFALVLVVYALVAYRRRKVTESLQRMQKR